MTNQVLVQFDQELDSELVKASALRMFDAGSTALEVSARFPHIKYDTVRTWKSRHEKQKKLKHIETVETVETTVSTVTKSVSNISETIETDVSIDSDTHETCDTGVLTHDTPLTHDVSSKRDTVETRDTPILTHDTSVSMPVTHSNDTRDTQLTRVSDTDYKTLIPIVLLGFVIVCVKYFSVSEVTQVLTQISTAKESVSSFAIVTVFTPLVLFLLRVTDDTKIYCVSVIVATVSIQVFCSGVSIFQSVSPVTSEMNKTLEAATFFSPKWFAWVFAMFRGLLDLTLEYILLENIKIKRDE